MRHELVKYSDEGVLIIQVPTETPEGVINQKDAIILKMHHQRYDILKELEGLKRYSTNKRPPIAHFQVSTGEFIKTEDVLVIIEKLKSQIHI